MNRTARRLLMAATSTIAGLALLEVGARVIIGEAAMLSIPAEQVRVHVGDGSDLSYDPLLGWKRTQLPSPLLGLDVNGFRHAHVEREKAPGVIRGFTLGDSQTYGAGVEASQSYAAVAEDKLRAEGLAVEVINTGLSGYHSLQVLRLIESKLLDFDPDFLVVDCMAGDAPAEDRPPQGNALREVLERTLFYSRLYRGLRLVVDQGEQRVGRAAKPNLALPDAKLGPPDRQNRPPGNHAAIADLGRARGIEVFFLDYPFQASPAKSLFTRDDLPPGGRFVATVPGLVASRLSPQELFYDKNHLSPEGNAVVGTVLAAEIAEWLAEDAAP